MKNIILFVGVYLFGISIDLIWLRLIANKIYVDEIGLLLRRQGSEIASNVPSALLVYAIISCGIIYFALPKAGNSYNCSRCLSCCSSAKSFTLLGCIVRKDNTSRTISLGSIKEPE